MSRADLRAIVSAAARVASDPAIVPALVASTGLSREGVELALREHLELDVTDEELDVLVASARPVARVHVVLSANVFVGALRSLVLARAAAPQVTVRPSSREPVFAKALVESLAAPWLRLADIGVGELEEGELHVYGHDQTIAGVRSVARVPVVGHGTGMGVAFLPAGTPHAAAALALARDVVAFDQRGCLSPRIVFVEELGSSSSAVSAAPAFAGELAAALEARGRDVPRGILTESEREESARWADAVAMAGTLHRGGSSLVGFAPGLLLPPSGRAVHVMPWAPSAFEPIARWVTVVGAPTLEAAASIAPAHARLATLGTMQRPRLDGPVDRR